VKVTRSPGVMPERLIAFCTLAREAAERPATSAILLCMSKGSGLEPTPNHSSPRYKPQSAVVPPHPDNVQCESDSPPSESDSPDPPGSGERWLRGRLRVPPSPPRDGWRGNCHWHSAQRGSRDYPRVLPRCQPRPRLRPRARALSWAAVASAKLTSALRNQDRSSRLAPSAVRAWP